MKVVRPNDYFADTLGDLPLFSALDPSRRRSLLACASILTCQAGDILFEHNQPAGAFYLLKHGRIKMRRITGSGKEIILHISEPPQIIGCRGLTQPGSKYPADGVALEDAMVLRFTRDEFVRRVAETADVYFELLVEMNQRLFEVFTIKATLLEPVSRRIAALVLCQALPPGADQQDWEQHELRPVRLTKSLIAGIVGTTTETAIRILSKWRKQGWIEGSRGVINLVNPAAIYQMTQGRSTTSGLDQQLCPSREAIMDDQTFSV